MRSADVGIPLARWVMLVVMNMPYDGDDEFWTSGATLAAAAAAESAHLARTRSREADLKRCKTPSPSSPTDTEASQQGTQHADDDDWMMNLSPGTLTKLDAQMAKHNTRSRKADLIGYKTPSPSSPTATEASQQGTQDAEDEDWMMHLSPATLKNMDALVAEHSNTARNVPNDSAKPASTAAADATETGNLLQHFNDTSMELLMSTPARSTADSWDLSSIGSDLLDATYDAAAALYAGAEPPTSIPTGRSGSTSPTCRSLEHELNQPATPATAPAAPPAPPEESPMYNGPYSATSPSYSPTPTPPPAPAKRQHPARFRKLPFKLREQ